MNRDKQKQIADAARDYIKSFDEYQELDDRREVVRDIIESNAQHLRRLLEYKTVELLLDKKRYRLNGNGRIVEEISEIEIIEIDGDL